MLLHLGESSSGQWMMSRKARAKCRSGIFIAQNRKEKTERRGTIYALSLQDPSFPELVQVVHPFSPPTPSDPMPSHFSSNLLPQPASKAIAGPFQLGWLTTQGWKGASAVWRCNVCKSATATPSRANIRLGAHICGRGVSGQSGHSGSPRRSLTVTSRVLAELAPSWTVSPRACQLLD